MIYAYYLDRTPCMHAWFPMAQVVSMHAGSSNIVAVLAPVSVADLRSDRSLSISLPPAMGKAHTSRFSPVDPLINSAVSVVRTHSNSTKEIQQFHCQSNHANNSIQQHNTSESKQCNAMTNMTHNGTFNNSSFK